jgi:predicted metal-dependent HD superfamily phosphohydrolase
MLSAIDIDRNELKWVKTRRWRAGRTVQSSEVPMRWMLLKKGKQVIARAEPAACANTEFAVKRFRESALRGIDLLF